MYLRRAVAATTFAGEAALREDAVHLADRADVRTLIRQLVISSGLNGKWVTANDTERSGELWAWGEWEAESTAHELSRPGGDPRLSPYLWTPHYVSRPSYAGLHNTDPFIFGKRFLYSNCGQPRGGSSGLRHLGRGSVIIFGSQFKKEWVLDTVFVVAGSKRYKASRARTMLKRHASNAFLDVTGGPIVDNGEEGELRFYWGATPRDRVDEMYSFFPEACV